MLSPIPSLINNMPCVYQTTNYLKIVSEDGANFLMLTVPWLLILFYKKSDPKNGRFEMYYVDHLF